MEKTYFSLKNICQIWYLGKQNLISGWTKYDIWCNKIWYLGKQNMISVETKSDIWWNNIHPIYIEKKYLSEKLTSSISPNVDCLFVCPWQCECWTLMMTGSFTDNFICNSNSRMLIQQAGLDITVLWSVEEVGESSDTWHCLSIQVSGWQCVPLYHVIPTPSPRTAHL